MATGSAGRDLGKKLVTAGFINQEQLKKIEEKVSSGKERLIWSVYQSGQITDEGKLASFLAEQLGVPVVLNINTYKMDPQVTKMITGLQAARYHLIPLYKIKNSLTVAMVDPLDLNAIEELEIKTKCRIEPVVSPPSQITAAVQAAYGVFDLVQEIVSSLDEETLTPIEQRIEEEQILPATEVAGIISKMVNLLITQAIHDGASDIHLEPTPDKLTVRYRVDGLLRETFSLPRNFHPVLTSSIKILARLDIAEKRLPQDGSFRVNVDGRDINLRISTYPTIHGEKVVLRILETESVLYDLAKLGFPDDTLVKFKQVISRPYGIFLVTGPTGSGKTTTLYAVLNKIKDPTRNILTIEDPVEYQVEGVNQGQVNVKAGLTFARALRSFLRQDPNVILVGEIRDPETAETAIQAAQTGHLVLSTLHTNDAPSAVIRLIDMGIEPFLVASTVEGVLAQRLVRLICPHCKESYQPQAEVVERLGLAEDKKYEFFKGRGCKSCRHTGYAGRTGIYELWVPSERIRNLIISKASASSLREVARAEGMRTLMEEGVQKVLQGLTTAEEVIRVTKEVEK